MMVCAGRMTATARRDIGAVFKPDDKAWVRGCVQMCDDAVRRAAISIGSLLCFAHRQKHREDGMAKKGSKRCEQLPILHPDAAGIDVGASELGLA